MRNTLIVAILFILSLPGQAQDTPLRYLALGDSYTIGESVSPSERWPVQLVDSLRSRGLKVHKPDIIATTGWTTLDLKRAILDTELQSDYDLVSLLIGVNDQYQGKEINKYPDRFRYLLEKAISLAGGNPRRVVVLSIPDYGVTPFGRKKNPGRITEELQDYNNINAAISDSLGAHYVNITPISKEAATDSSLLAPDGLHPSAEMYSLWTEKTVAEIFNMLKNTLKDTDEPGQGN